YHRPQPPWSAAWASLLSCVRGRSADGRRAWGWRWCWAHSGVAGAPAVEVAAIADDRGNVVNYSRVYPPKPINVMDREYFAVYSGPAPPPGAWVSAPVRNRTNGKWTFYIGRRIDAPGGRFLGLIVVGLTSKYFAQFYEALALGTSADLRLYRDDLTLLATAPERSEPLG